MYPDQLRDALATSLWFYRTANTIKVLPDGNGSKAEMAAQFVFGALIGNRPTAAKVDGILAILREHAQFPLSQARTLALTYLILEEPA